MKGVFSLFLIALFFHSVFAQNEDLSTSKDILKKNSSINDLVATLNDRIQFLNDLAASASEYNRKLYQYFKTGDPAFKTPFRFRNSSGVSLVLPNDKKLKIEQDEIIEKHKRLNIFGVSSLVNSFLQNEKQIIQTARKFNLEKDTRYTKQYIDTINHRFNSLGVLYGRLANDLDRLKNRLQIEFKEIAINNQDVGEALKLTKKMEDVLNRVKYGNPSDLEKYVDEIYVLKERWVKVPVIYKKLSRFVSLIESYKKMDTTQLKYVWMKEYFVSKETIIRYKPKTLFYNELMHTYAGKDFPEDTSIVDWKNSLLKKLSDVRLFDFTPISMFENLEFKFSKRILFRKDLEEFFLILILDISGSMDKEGRLDKLKEAVNLIVDAYREQDKLGIILFSSTTSTLVGPRDKDKSYIKEKVNNIKAFGETYPESAIEVAYNIFNSTKLAPKNNKIILITDGNFDVTPKMKNLIATGTNKNIKFSLIRLQGDTQSKNDLDAVTNLVKLGKGRYYPITNDEPIENLIHKEIEIE